MQRLFECQGWYSTQHARQAQIRVGCRATLQGGIESPRRGTSGTHGFASPEECASRGSVVGSVVEHRRRRRSSSPGKQRPQRPRTLDGRNRSAIHTATNQTESGGAGPNESQIRQQRGTHGWCGQQQQQQLDARDRQRSQLQSEQRWRRRLRHWRSRYGQCHQWCVECVLDGIVAGIVCRVDRRVRSERRFHQGVRLEPGKYRHGVRRELLEFSQDDRRRCGVVRYPTRLTGRPASPATRHSIAQTKDEQIQWIRIIDEYEYEYLLEHV
mmetsp:Transcript_18114/g.50387  ORF Transcript_18114/g.50387 Transcript_18114/m.50387 type:complete len:269 (+) Transcript_18114:574-1380(+)